MATSLDLRIWDHIVVTIFTFQPHSNGQVLLEFQEHLHRPLRDFLWWGSWMCWHQVLPNLLSLFGRGGSCSILTSGCLQNRQEGVPRHPWVAGALVVSSCPRNLAPGVLVSEGLV